MLDLLGLFVGSALAAETLTFGIATKGLNDYNMRLAWQGCSEEAIKNNDICLHIGVAGNPHARHQATAINEAIEEGLDGLAISVIDSDVIIDKVGDKILQSNIPLITFDSDLSGSHKFYRRSYIGPDNKAFGFELGETANKLRPKGGKVCLMTSQFDSPNMTERMTGVLAALGANSTGQLKGRWIQDHRCPWRTADNPQQAIKQLKYTLEHIDVDAFIALGFWPQEDARLYRQMIQSFKASHIDTDKTLLIIAGATPGQQRLLKDGLAHANLTPDFTEMGREVYRQLKKLRNGQDIPETVLIPSWAITRSSPDIKTSILNTGTH